MDDAIVEVSEINDSNTDIGVLFGLAMLYITYDHYKRKGLDLKDIAGWVVLWCTFIFVILFPTALLFVSKKLNLTRAIDLIMIVSFVVMIYLVFNTIESRRLSGIWRRWLR